RGGGPAGAGRCGSFGSQWRGAAGGEQPGWIYAIGPVGGGAPPVGRNGGNDSAGGRPCKLTPAVQRRLCAALRKGVHYEEACALAGIGYRTFARWMKEGKRQQRGEFREFREAVEQASNWAAGALARRCFELSAKSAKDGLAFLGRRWPGRWGDQARELRELRKELKALALAVHGGGPARPRDLSDRPGG